MKAKKFLYKLLCLSIWFVVATPVVAQKISPPKCADPTLGFNAGGPTNPDHHGCGEDEHPHPESPGGQMLDNIANPFGAIAQRSVASLVAPRMHTDIGLTSTWPARCFPPDCSCGSDRDALNACNLAAGVPVQGPTIAQIDLSVAMLKEYRAAYADGLCAEAKTFGFVRVDECDVSQALCQSAQLGNACICEGDNSTRCTQYLQALAVITPVSGANNTFVKDRPAPASRDQSGMNLDWSVGGLLEGAIEVGIGLSPVQIGVEIIFGGPTTTTFPFIGLPRRPNPPRAPGVLGACSVGYGGEGAAPNPRCDFSTPMSLPPDQPGCSWDQDMCTRKCANKLVNGGWVLTDPHNSQTGCPPNTETYWVLNDDAAGAADQCLGGQDQCMWYIRLRDCGNCTGIDRSRLMGYWQTCRNMSNGANSGGTPFAGGADMPVPCNKNCEYMQYVSEMRHCLQVRVSDMLVGNCVNCSQLVNGLPNQPYSGVIPGHTPCNADSGFCQLNSGSRKCFGAGLGQSWGGIGFPSGHSPFGSVQSVGLCHMVQQALSCAARTDDFIGWWDEMCEGYQAGCNSTGAEGGSINCAASCPRPHQIAEFCPGGLLGSAACNLLIGVAGGGLEYLTTAQFAEIFESMCTSVIGSGPGNGGNW